MFKEIQEKGLAQNGVLILTIKEKDGLFAIGVVMPSRNDSLLISDAAADELDEHFIKMISDDAPEPIIISNVTSLGIKEPPKKATTTTTSTKKGAKKEEAPKIEFEDDDDKTENIEDVSQSTREESHGTEVVEVQTKEVPKEVVEDISVNIPKGGPANIPEVETKPAEAEHKEAKELFTPKSSDFDDF